MNDFSGWEHEENIWDPSGGNINTGPYSGQDESARGASDPRNSVRGSTPQSGESSERRVLHTVAPGNPAFPRSSYTGWEPPLARADEIEAVADLVAGAAFRQDEREHDFVYITLNDFSVYCTQDHPKKSGELVGLERLNNKDGTNDALFSGVLSVNGTSHYVQDVRFRVVTIEGYGDSEITNLDGRICLQSHHAAKLKKNVWYKLGRPALEYQRFYQPFLWLALFTKYTIEYLLETEKVTIKHFREPFSKWLADIYGQNTAFKSWWSECNYRRDFATTASANVGFLWKEAYGLRFDSPELTEHPLWGEIHPHQLTTVRPQPNIEHNTIVTPFAFRLHLESYFASKLEKRGISDPTLLHDVRRRKRGMKLTPSFDHDFENAFAVPSSLTPDAESFTNDGDISPAARRVQQGDVVSVNSDTTGKWKAAATDWYAFVQQVRGDRLDVLWLYQSHDTTIGSSPYAFPNELFLSDNCGCGEDALWIESVTGVEDVLYTYDPKVARGKPFLRRKYRTITEEDSYGFFALQSSDFRCACRSEESLFQECRKKYAIGETVLFKPDGDSWEQDERGQLEPAQVADFDLDNELVILRPFSRCERLQARKNELVLANALLGCAPEDIERHCYVRIFSELRLREGLPCPYDRGGAGDYFFFIKNGINDKGDDSAEFPPLEQGFDPGAPPPFAPLKGLGLFCGGGNFDRGLEEAGAVKFCGAVDWDEHANAGEANLFFGSVNDMLARALSGDNSVIRPGAIGFLSAGSPCPAFSTLQVDKLSDKSLQNASMLASVVSYVDTYNPMYCILENVYGMSRQVGDTRQIPFSQMIASFVALGYQVQQFLLDSWSFRSCQSRSRIFIVASGPECVPFTPLAPTHAHPPGKFMSRSLGKSSNGQPFGLRRNVRTPFRHVSPAEATKDLPGLDDAQVQICPKFPDHRVHAESGAIHRARMASVPTYPRGMGLHDAGEQGILKGEALHYYQTKGRVKAKAAGKRYFARIHPDGLIPCLSTVFALQDAKNGGTMHWDQSRNLSLMELRRGQGFLDHDVIVGNGSHRNRVIGNSVDRNPALALGLKLRESWAETDTRKPEELGDHAYESDDDDFVAVDLATVEGSWKLERDLTRRIRHNPAHGFRLIDEALDRKATVDRDGTAKPVETTDLVSESESEGVDQMSTQNAYTLGGNGVIDLMSDEH